MQEAASQDVPLLTTKLYRPPISPDLEPRDALLERLSRNRQRPLTLISAPAGYGKSTLASMWLEASGSPSTWVSLDEGDNDLATFTSYLVAAVQRVFPEARLETQALLQAPTMAAVSVVARYLLNDLDQVGEPFILALDDVHRIHEQVVFDLLAELLRHPSPNIHLVLITRRDPPLPIVSMRARRQITEVRSRDLRFTIPEAQRLLSKMLHRAIDEATAAEWTARTEGWVTALQLAALSLAHRDPADVRGGGIPVDSRYLQEYLLTEVLAHLDPVKQERLLAASLLDRFCGPLCEAIWPLDAAGGEETFTGEQFVRWLREDNLFLIPLDDQHQWFRFHHVFQHLVQRFLRERAESDEIAAIHRRASHWFAKNGLIGEAIRHALAAGDMSTATQLVVRHRYELMNTEQWHRLERWIRLLPDDVVAQSPYLLSTRAYLGIYSGQDQEMVFNAQLAGQLLAALPTEAKESKIIQAELAVIQGVVDVILARPGQAIANAQLALEQLPPRALHIRGIAHAVVPVGLQMQGEYRQALEMFREILDDPIWPKNIVAKLVNYQAIAGFMEADLNRVLATSHECLRISQEFKLPESASFARYFLGTTHYLRNELADAEPILLALLENRMLSAPTYLAQGTLALALIHVLRGRPAEAKQVMALVRNQLQETRDTWALAIVGAFEVELALRLGNLAEARRTSAGIDFDLRPPIWFFYVSQLTPVKLLLAENTPKSLARARDALESLDERMASIHRKVVRIDVLSLLALVCDAQGDTAAACSKLEEALRMAEPGGFIRSFVDLGPPMAYLLARLHRQSKAWQPGMLTYIARLLAAFPKTGPQGSPAKLAPAASPLVAPSHLLAEPLTQRESQILKLLATELSPADMASELVLSIGTVRTHIKNIYAKLGVHRRIEAVHRARELDLL
jgi:LuxR family maltose regulon positive regulatory protein